MSKDYVMQLEATIQNLRRDNALLKELNAKYKDLEEKIGCSFDVVVKAINKGIFAEDLPSGKIVRWHGLRLSRVETEWYLSNEKICVGLKDYRKIWWLREDRSE